MKDGCVVGGRLLLVRKVVGRVVALFEFRTVGMSDHSTSKKRGSRLTNAAHRATPGTIHKKGQQH